MKNHAIYRFKFAAGVLLAAFNAHGDSGSMSLTDAVQTTIVRNAAMQASAQNISAAEAMTRVARAGKLPRVDFRYSLNVSDDPLDAFAEKLRTRSVVTDDFAPERLNDPSTSTLFSGGVVAKYSLYNGGRTDAQIDRALQHEDAARAQHARTIQDLVFNTIRAYYGAQAAEQALRIARDAETAAKIHARTTRQLVQDDRTVRSDQLTARVNLSSFKSLHTQARTRATLAYNRLKLAMNLPQAQVIQVPPLSRRTSLAPTPDLSTIEQRALAQRQDLKAVRAALKAAEAAVIAQRAANGFQLDLMADTFWHKDNPAIDENAWRVFGVLRKDLYNGGRSKGNIDAAVARAEAIRLHSEALIHRIRAQVHAAYAQLQDATKRLQLAEGNVSTARDNVRLITERYGQGRTILIDLLQAERALVEARNEELAAAQALITSIAALRLADGSLDPAAPGSYLTVAK